MWEGTVNGSAATASTKRDSNFIGDSFSNGHGLNNEVNAMDDRFQTTSVQGYSYIGYDTTLGICLPPGQIRFYSTGVTSAMTSFKSC